MSSEHDSSPITVPRFGLAPYVLFVAIGAAIWATGVVVVRLLGADFFEENSGLLVAMFVASVPLGVGTQFAVGALLRLQVADTLVPIVVMCATALLCDGISIAFTDIYASADDVRMTVGGWLLWTFGAQLAITLAIVVRTRSDK